MTRRAALLAAALLAAALAACAAEPAPVAPSAPAAPVADEAGARKAAEVALGSLSKRNFEVGECAAAELRIVPEAEARAGAPVGDRCTILVARLADKRWLLGIRPATRAAPVRAGGSLALVTVTPGGEGVAHIEYVRP